MRDDVEFQVAAADPNVRDAADRVAAREEVAPGLRFAGTLWVVVALFGLITLAWSAHVDVPMRDPGGIMFRERLTTALVLLAILALVEAVVRSVRAGWSWRGPLEALRTRWTWQRVTLAVSGLLAYHLVYVCYRNLKSWDAFNTPLDDDLLALDKAVFLGHSPAVLLHDLLGQHEAALFLAVVYRSFTYLVMFSVVGSLVVVRRIREAYVFLCAATWAWILATASYYLVPSLGPFASAPQEFAGLTSTAITSTQAKYLAERAHFLQDPRASDAFVSISAFASLHVGFTCLVVLMCRYYGWRILARVLSVYLALVMVSTVYFGWHFVSDVVAGVVLAGLAVLLGRLTVYPRTLGRAPVPPSTSTEPGRP